MIPDDNPQSVPASGWAAIPWYYGRLSVADRNSNIYYLPKSLSTSLSQMVKRWSQRVTDQQTLNILQSLQAELEVSQQVKLQVCPLSQVL